MAELAILSSTPNLYEESYLLRGESYDNIDLGRPIASGTYSLVYVSPKSSEVAIKKFHDIEKDNTPPASFIVEAAILVRCEHENICKLRDVFSMLGEQYAALDMADGTLDDFYHSFDPQKKERISLALINVLAYIHERGIIHRDIKPKNILIKAGEPLLIDFGSSLVYIGTNNCEAAVAVTTITYRPPEMMLEKKKLYNDKIDIWSLGCVLWELFTCRPLFCINDYDENTSELNLEAEMIGKIFDRMGDPRLSWPSVIETSEWKRYHRRLTEGTPPMWHQTVATTPIYHLLRQMLRYNPASRSSAKILLGLEEVSPMKALKARERYPKKYPNLHRKEDLTKLISAAEKKIPFKTILVAIHLYDEICFIYHSKALDVHKKTTDLFLCALLSIAVDFSSHYTYFYVEYASGLDFFLVDSRIVIELRRSILQDLSYDLIFPTLLDFYQIYGGILTNETSSLILNKYTSGECFERKLSKIANSIILSTNLV